MKMKNAVLSGSGGICKKRNESWRLSRSIEPRI
jgi:hypothetical protein